MSEYQILTVLAAFVFLYSIVASRLERTPFSGAVIYLFVGLACGSYGLQLVKLDVDGEGLKLLAEIHFGAGALRGFSERESWRASQSRGESRFDCCWSDFR